MASNRPFGNFLRSRRTRLCPENLSDEARKRRRTSGLKREEVAQRAGISVEWYVKLEQGRAVTPSRETVEALGDALRLDRIERAHLHSLAVAGGRQPFRREEAPDILRAIVSDMPGPAYITGQRFDILAWNDATTALFGDFGRIAHDDRNVMHWMLTDPAAKKVFGQSWPDEAHRIVSLFRASYDLWPGDPTFIALVDQVRERCPEFEGWWTEHGIGAPISGVKWLHHPTQGLVRYDYATFQANDDPALKLALYMSGAACRSGRAKAGDGK
ncbi:helix-turn-helix transcriptional regulator [Stakelama sp. CBK3Z-3]|uniref:Helix-turn-helix transcriptional regulator n=1 Tax=Stakelama flava TaxID=2860338 RepID=A0ABS6XIQ9_9SPHN|nr:helix-turn-helix transcriptional regulator [Stakelama flava]MBW4330093.1 helix-turn-helix transcriptional regulator [Stakelama flava]